MKKKTNKKGTITKKQVDESYKATENIENNTSFFLNEDISRPIEPMPEVKLNTKTQLKFDQIQIGDRLVVLQDGLKTISNWKVVNKTEVEVSLAHDDMHGGGLYYTPEEVQELEFARIIQ